MGATRDRGGRPAGWALPPARRSAGTSGTRLRPLRSKPLCVCSPANKRVPPQRPRGPRRWPGESSRPSHDKRLGAWAWACRATVKPVDPTLPKEYTSTARWGPPCGAQEPPQGSPHCSRVPVAQL